MLETKTGNRAFHVLTEVILYLTDRNTVKKWEMLFDRFREVLANHSDEANYCAALALSYFILRHPTDKAVSADAVIRDMVEHSMVVQGSSRFGSKLVPLVLAPGAYERLKRVTLANLEAFAVAADGGATVLSMDHESHLVVWQNLLLLLDV